MKKLNYLFLALALALSFSTSLRAQEGPYLEALYDVEVTSNQMYGVNATILPIIAQVSNEALPRPLLADVYEPVGDDDNGPRPVMFVFHTGNFLPFPDNNGTGGTKTDSTVVEVCNRLAQRGYVAVSVDYRLGWNPIDPSQDIRKFFLINAAYRGVQDARTAVRWMRKLAVDEGNPYNVNVDAMGYWGIGTGGYIAAAAGTIDEYMEIVIPKFLIDLDGPGPAPTVPMVVEAINGNIFGTSVGIVPAGFPVFPEGDTLCYPNHVTYDDGSTISSEVSLVVNNGGALGDISWIDENTPPWVSFHVPTDPFAPYTTGTLTVPGTGDPGDPSDDFAVVEVSGSYDIQAEMNALGNNDIFLDIPAGLTDYSEVADDRNDGHEGLFPFPQADPQSSAPWDFYAADNPNVPPNPPPNPVLARTYWDTIMAYTGVRACVALNLGCTFQDVKTLNPAQVDLKLAPNPASDYVAINTDAAYPIRNIQVFDMSGRMVDSYFNLNSNSFTLNRNALSSGMYFLRLRFDDGIAVQKLVFE
jgi:hypothetical protein